MNLRDQIRGAPGYSTLLEISTFDLFKLRQVVDRHYREALGEQGAKYLPVPLYHHVGLVNHDRLCEKRNRILSGADVDRIKALDFMEFLRDEFGPYTLSQTKWRDAEHDGKEEIHWRIVRPNEPGDIAGTHRDTDSHYRADGERSFAPGIETIKVWIPLYCDPGCGLTVWPNSHEPDWAENAIRGTVIESVPGDTVIFGDHLWHCGNLNTGKHTRVSMEITLVLA